MEREARLQGTLHLSQKPHLLGIPVKKPSLKAPLMESLIERGYIIRASFIHLSKSPVYEPPSHIPGSPQMERGPHGERCPYPETFATYIPGFPVMELPLRLPPWSLFKESCSIPRAHFIQLSKPQVP